MSFGIGGGKIHDREWQEGVVKLIQKAKVPVVPVFISGQNSRFFYFLGRIGWRIRTARLCHELDTKKGKTINMVFGDPITVAEQQQHPDIKDLAHFLQEKTYQLNTIII